MEPGFVGGPAASNADGRLARRAPAAHLPDPGSSRGSLACSTSAADWRPCWHAHRRLSSSSAGGAGCVDRGRIIPGNAGTCVFCGVSSVGSPLYTNDGKPAACGPGQTPPNSRPSATPDGRRRRRKEQQIEEGKRGRTRSSSAVSERPSGYDFRPALTRAPHAS